MINSPIRQPLCKILFSLRKLPFIPIGDIKVKLLQYSGYLAANPTPTAAPRQYPKIETALRSNLRTKKKSIRWIARFSTFEIILNLQEALLLVLPKYLSYLEHRSKDS
jgi:hypothetical protein